MENLIESLNLINFEKFDYEYTIENLVIDINKLNTDQITDRDIKSRKTDKDKNDISLIFSIFNK